MSRMMIALASALTLAIAVQAPAFADGNKTGFATDSGQGNLGNENVKNNPGTTSVSGPNGQIKQGNTGCNNCTTNPPGNRSY